MKSVVFHPDIESILLTAITKGVLYCFKILMDSNVCGLKPSLISIITTAISAKDPPLFLNVVNA